MELAINILGEKRLYRFRSIDHNKLEQTSRIFTHSELYFASPTQLNDPWESKPHIFVGDLSEPGYKNKYITFAFHMMMKDKPDNDPLKVRRWLENHTKQQAADLVRQMAEQYHQSLEKNYRICSFSDKATHPLLWSHYANSHRGFCLEFDATTDIFGHAMRVKYQKAYPAIDFTEPDEDINFRVSVLTKADFWDYEGEYRLVSMEPNEAGALPVNNHLFRFPEHLLTGVIFGCQMPKSDKDLVIEWSAARTVEIRYRKAVKNATSFALDIVPA